MRAFVSICEITYRSSASSIRDNPIIDLLKTLSFSTAPEFLDAPTTPAVAEETLEINYFGLVRTDPISTPHLLQPARCATFSSPFFAHMPELSTCRAAPGGSPGSARRTPTPGLTINQLTALVERVLNDVKEGTHQTRGWPRNWLAYSVSKIATVAVSGILARSIAEDAHTRVTLDGCGRTWVDHGRREVL
ncbi:hypothetical protein BC938DRAFT_470782, partial [Jimgerdemannia flammicorona]